MRKILIAVSSTGGHIYPGIAVAEELKKNGWDVFFVGKNPDPIVKLGYKFYRVSTVGFKREFSLKVVVFFVKLLYSIIQSLIIFAKEKPSVVIGFGGYVSFPLIFVAHLKGVPSIIHEQNIVAGVANKLSAKFANKICVGFEETKKGFISKKIILTGNPIRQAILSIRTLPFTIYHLPFTVLIFGGSQGAHAINVAITNSLKKLSEIKEKIHFIHLTGASDYEMVKEAYQKNGFAADVYKYLDSIEEVYQKASLVVCRAGAITIAELVAVKIPAILIPYPFSTEGHQIKNAQYLSENGCAIFLEEAQIGMLLEKVLELISQPQVLQKMSEAYFKISSLDAVKKIVDVVDCCHLKIKSAHF